jgi:predicted RNase H-like HicB family nuclease
MGTRFGGRIHFGTLTGGVEYPPGTAYRCRVDLTPEPGGGYSAVVPRLPGVAGRGRDVAGALANVREALAGALGVYQGAGEAVPWADAPGHAPPGVLVRWVVVRRG